MSYKTYKMVKVVLTMFTAMIASAAIVAGNPFLPALAVIISLAITLVIRRKVKEVVVDERTYSIASKASLLAYQVFGIAAATLGATLIALGRSGYPALQQTGFTLAYAVCGLLVINYLAYVYYNHKMGGAA